MPKTSASSNGRPEVTHVFSASIGPYSKKLVSLHPHLYDSLYNRASEIHALDKILTQLLKAADEARSRRYTQLPPILEAIKEALQGQSSLSWWKLFTTSLGRALGSSGNHQSKNFEEKNYLTKISEQLTDIIRSYQSTNTKLLLDIRLTALEVDARLVELEKIPENTEKFNDTCEYLASQFQLIIQELKKTLGLPKENWGQNHKILFDFGSKVSRLMSVTYNIESTDPAAYNQFLSFGYISQLQELMKNLLKETHLSISAFKEIESRGLEAIESFLELFSYFPELLLILSPKELYNFLEPLEKLFIANPMSDKVRPAIFFSTALKKYVLHHAANSKAQFASLQNAVKEHRIASSENLVEQHKEYFIAENNLHHIASLIHTTKKDTFLMPFDAEQIQTEILKRMVQFANASQPKDLDMVLKSFTEEEKENRYFLTQEIILEQFIRWRKIGIY